MWFSLVFSIWFPMRAASCLMHSVRKAMGRGRPKNAVIGTLRTWRSSRPGVDIVAILVVSLVLTTVGRRALAFVSGLVTLPAGFVNLWSSLRFVLLGVAVFSLLVPLYMLAQGERRPLREIVPGVAASSAVWMLLSFAFSYYVEHLARYTQLYGAIAAIVVVLLWLMSGTITVTTGRRIQRRDSAMEEQRWPLGGRGRNRHEDYHRWQRQGGLCHRPPAVR